MSNPRRANGHRRSSLIARVKAMARPCWICGLPIDLSRHHLDPEAFALDELLPVSKGGSPLDIGNVDSAHRCCNGWRRDRSVSFVRRIQSMLAKGAYSTPQGFIKAAQEAERRGAPKMPEGVETTTEW